MAHIGIFPVMSGRQAGGPETYERELVAQLARLDPVNRYTLLCLGEEAAAALRNDRPNFGFEVLRPRARAISMLLTLPRRLSALGVDLLHAAYIAPPFSPVPYAFTLHCSSPFMRPELFPPLIRARLRALIWRGMHAARHVICVSQHVLDLAADRYDTPRERLSVIYNGVGRHFRPVPEAERRVALARAGIDAPYALFVGRLEPRKNLLRVIEAFDLFRREVDPAMRLVLAGRKTWQGDAVDALVGRLGLRRHVVEVGHVANEELPAFYSGAAMFLFPSLWEGFGIPVVEAMACGTPVITSNLSSLPEIAGDAALLVDPLSVQAIAGAMERLHRDDALRARLVEAGCARARDFSWGKTAEQTLALYRRLA